EVVRGPATLRYGSGAIGGVVAAENGRIPTAMPRHGVAGEIKGGLSSVDNGRDGAFKATAGAQGVVVHADGFKRHSDDYETPRGKERNSFVDSEGVGLGISRVWSDGFLGIAVSRIDSVYGVPGEEARDGVDPRIDMAQQKIQARSEWRPKVMGVEAVRFWLGASTYNHNELAKLDGDVFEVGSRFKNNEQEGRVEIQHMPVMTSFGELTGAAGVQVVYRRTRGESFEGESLLEPARTGSVAAFLFEELQTSATTKLQAALRIEQTKVDGFGWSDVSVPDAPVEFDGERRFVPVSASLGVLQKLGFGTVARLTGQYVERAPDAAELYSKGMHEATGTFEIGNPFLDKEKAFTIEAGLAKARGALRFDAAAYYTKYKGFVHRALTGAKCTEDLPSCGTAEAEAAEENFDQVLLRQRDATFYGVELAAQYDVAPIWRGVWGVEGQYDFVHARFEGGENAPRIPPHRLGGGLYYRDSNWFARAGVLHAFDQNRIGANEIATPGYTLVSAEFSYTTRLDNGSVTGPGTQLTIGLKGENIADDEVLNHASFKRREEVLAPGASVRLFGSIKLD
ncbi:MAG: TonB-dependent receptor, partial [Hyphomicrobium sp.]